MKGTNYIRMSGYLMYPELVPTSTGGVRFKGRIAVPVSYNAGGEQVERKEFYHLCAFGAVAEGLGELSNNMPVQIDGSLRVRSYTAPCNGCGEVDKKYWTEIIVSNFIIVTE